MEATYQERDAHIIDYRTYRLAGLQGSFRGPPVSGHDYVACIGAAQTFGRFVEKPFPALIAESLGIETLNLGRGGAGPTFFVSNPEIMEHLNRARLVIVQVMSGRSQSNSLFQTIGNGMRGVSAIDGREMIAGQFFTWLMGQEEDLKRKIVDETRSNYVAAMKQLLAAIRPPKILLWISTRPPDYQEQLRLPVWHLFGAFPQLVNRAMIEQMRGDADLYVECVSRRGWPQPLIDRSGNPTTVEMPAMDETRITENRYYPSPEMHEDAAALLLPACRELLNPGAATPIVGVTRGGGQSDDSARPL